MSMAYICSYHNISTGQHCSGDNMILELEMFKPSSKYRLIFLIFMEFCKTSWGNKSWVTHLKVKFIHRDRLSIIYELNTENITKSWCAIQVPGKCAQFNVNTSFLWGYLKVRHGAWGLYSDESNEEEIWRGNEEEERRKRKGRKGERRGRLRWKENRGDGESMDWKMEIRKK